jgi:hypothetical protein
VFNFTTEDVKVGLEVLGPIFGCVWYLRGTLVKLDATLTELGRRVRDTETDVERHDTRLRFVETHIPRSSR